MVVSSTMMPPLPLRRRLRPGPRHCTSGVSEVSGPRLTVQVRLMAWPAMTSLRPVTSILSGARSVETRKGSDNFSSWLQILNAQFCGSNRFSHTIIMHIQNKAYIPYIRTTEAECGYKH